MLPAPSFFDGYAPPHAGCAVEIEEAPVRSAPAVFEHKVAVEQNGFHFRQKGIVRFSGSSASAPCQSCGSVKWWIMLQQEIFGRDKIGVEDGDELTLWRYCMPFAEPQPCIRGGSSGE